MMETKAEKTTTLNSDCRAYGKIQVYLANTKRFSARTPYEREKLRIKCLQIGFRKDLSQTLDTTEDQISLHVFDEVSVSKTKMSE